MRGEKSGGDGLWLSPRKRRGANGSGLELDLFELKSLVWRACHASRDTPPLPPGKEKLQGTRPVLQDCMGGGPRPASDTRALPWETVCSTLRSS